jgi:hypothetical protein
MPHGSSRVGRTVDEHSRLIAPKACARRPERFRKYHGGMRSVIGVVAAAVWISASEFLRNNLLLLHFWVDRYQQLGLTFPAKPLNGALWGLWSLLFAIAIFVIAQRFTLIETTLLSWFVAFVLMWVVIGNLLVLPVGILIYAVPLSLLEAFIATLIIKSIDKRAKPESLRGVSSGDG